uniref:Uncharacterized protein n=1 Tax=Aegilops tauschii subsp. strangulata TaxID=200361 RepID=A0A453LJU9_AEGTS
MAWKTILFHAPWHQMAWKTIHVLQCRVQLAHPLMMTSLLIHYSPQESAEHPIFSKSIWMACRIPESIQTTAEDVLELPLLPPEDVATPSKHKLSDQSTHNNPPEDVAAPRTATTRAQSSALSEAAENRSEVFDAPNLVSVLVSRPKMHRPSASPRRQSPRRRSSHWLRRRLVPILERPLTSAGYLVSSSTCLFAIRRAAAAPGMRERRAPRCRAPAR